MHAGRLSIDQKTALRLSNPQYLMKCDALSCDEVVKIVPNSPETKEEVCQVGDFFPLFITSFSRCQAFLWHHHLQALCFFLFSGLHTRKNVQRWALVSLSPGPPNLLLHRRCPLRLGLRMTWLQVLLQKSKMLDLFILAARVCRNFEPSDLPLKLLQRETAAKKTTTEHWSILAGWNSSTVISTLAAQPSVKAFW